MATEDAVPGAILRKAPSPIASVCVAVRPWRKAQARDPAESKSARVGVTDPRVIDFNDTASIFPSKSLLGAIVNDTDPVSAAVSTRDFDEEIAVVVP